MEKVAPSERFRRELDEVLAGVGEEQDPIETVGRLGARLILQQALEDEVSEFLGRSRYERAEDTVMKTMACTGPGAMVVIPPNVATDGWRDGSPLAGCRRWREAR